MKVKIFILYVIFFVLILWDLSIGLHNNPKLDYWQQTLHCLNYEFGFLPRSFIGSVLKLLCSGNITYSAIYKFLVFFWVICAAILSFVFAKVVFFAKENKILNIVGTVILLYLVSPGSLGFTTTFMNKGHFDIYLIFLTLLSLCGVYKEKYFFVSICTSVIIMIHPAGMFLYCPLIFACLLYKLFENKFDKKSLIYGAIILLPAGCLFVYFAFFAHPNLPLEQVYKIMSGTNSVEKILDYVIDICYYSTGIVSQINYMKFYSLNDLTLYVRKFIITVILLLPLFIPIAFFIIKLITSITDKYLKKVICLMFSLQIMIFPSFILACDYGRWFAAYIFFNVMLYLWIIYQNNPEILSHLRELEDKFAKKIVYYILIIFIAVYLFDLQKFDTVTPLPRYIEIYKHFDAYVDHSLL